MNDKEKLSMYVDITRITIILCWIALIAFWCLKLFGGNWFEIMVENENFIKFSDLVQNTWLKYLFNLFTIFVAQYLKIASVCQRFTFKGKDLIITIGLIISNWLIVNFVNIDIIKMSYGYVVIVLMGVLYQKHWKKCFGIIAIILEMAFTTLSMITRSIELQVMSDYFISIILSIDLYIMYALYYLYSNLIRINKENDMAIIVGSGWLSKESAQVNGYNAWKRFWHNVGYTLSFKWAKKK